MRGCARGEGGEERNQTAPSATRGRRLEATDGPSAHRPTRWFALIAQLKRGQGLGAGPQIVVEDTLGSPASSEIMLHVWVVLHCVQRHLTTDKRERCHSRRVRAQRRDSATLCRPRGGSESRWSAFVWQPAHLHVGRRRQGARRRPKADLQGPTRVWHEDPHA